VEERRAGCPGVACGRGPSGSRPGESGPGRLCGVLYLTIFDVY